MSKQLTLQERVSMWAAEVRGRAETMAPGPDQDELLKKIAQADEAPELYNWIKSPELQPPR